MDAVEMSELDKQYWQIPALRRFVEMRTQRLTEKEHEVFYDGD